jgi:hypothetical protein
LTALFTEDLPPVSSTDLQLVWWIFGGAVFAIFLFALVYNLAFEKKKEINEDEPATPEDPSFASKLFEDTPRH